MVEESLTFRSGRLGLEARLGWGEHLCEPRGKILICPPHPFLGGDMDNNVVTELVRTLAAADFIVLRFNYRGIGASEADRDLQADQQLFWEHSTCPGYEADIHVDCRNAFAYLRAIATTAAPLSVIGYSFGCLPAIAAAGRGETTRGLADRLAARAPRPLTSGAYGNTCEAVSQPCPEPPSELLVRYPFRAGTAGGAGAALEERARPASSRALAREY